MQYKCINRLIIFICIGNNNFVKNKLAMKKIFKILRECISFYSGLFTSQPIIGFNEIKESKYWISKHQNT